MITIGSLVLIVTLFWIFFKNSISRIFINLLTLTIFVELAIQRGYFIQIGEAQISYRTVCELALTLVSVTYLITVSRTVDLRLFKQYMLALGCLIIGWFLLALFPSAARGGTYSVSWDQALVGGVQLQNIQFTPNMFVEMMQVIMFLIISICAINSIKSDDWIDIYQRIIKFSRVYIYFCAIEFILINVFKSEFFRNTVDVILGNSVATVTSLYTRQNRYVLCGLTKEPSHLAFTLAIIVLLNIGYLEYTKLSNEEIYKRIKNKIYFTNILALLFMMFSMSFSAYYFIGCIGLFWLVIFCCKHGIKGSSTIAYIGIIIVTLTIVIIFIPEILSHMQINTFLGRRVISLFQEFSSAFSGNWSMITSSTLELSNKVRIGSTIETLKLLRYRPLFGLGLTSVTAHSAFAMLLTGCGLIGTYFYLNMAFYIRTIKIVDYKKSMYLICIFVYCFMNLFNSLALRPYYECWLLLVGVSFQFFTIDRENNHH